MRFHNSEKASRTRGFFVGPRTVGLLKMTGKNRSYGWTLAGTVVIVCFVLLGGCLGKGTQQDTQFYLLEPISGISSVEHTSSDDVSIGLAIGPVRLREYLYRPQMVTRTEENEIIIDNFHSWGEPLDKNFTIVLAANLSELLATNKIVIFPWRKRPPDLEYQIVVDVMRFDGDLGGRASLIVHYYISAVGESEGEERRIGIWKSSFSRQTGDDSYKALVATMSELVDDFSREVAEKLKGASDG
jgi:uncharacterized lipoprotein YmbA